MKLLKKTKLADKMLLRAAARGDLEAVKYWLKGTFLSGKADINITKDSENPLSLALENNHMHVADELVRQKADLRPALIWASYLGRTDAIDYLIKSGVDVNCSSIYQHTPLYFATGCGHFDAVRLLIENGADYDVKVGGNDFDAKDLVLIARSEGYSDIANYIENCRKNKMKEKTAMSVQSKSPYTTEELLRLSKTDPARFSKVVDIQQMAEVIEGLNYQDTLELYNKIKLAPIIKDNPKNKLFIQDKIRHKRVNEG